jgi:hypothetical protein
MSDPTGDRVARALPGSTAMIRAGGWDARGGG